MFRWERSLVQSNYSIEALCNRPLFRSPLPANWVVPAVLLQCRQSVPTSLSTPARAKADALAHLQPCQRSCLQAVELEGVGTAAVLDRAAAAVFELAKQLISVHHCPPCSRRQGLQQSVPRRIGSTFCLVLVLFYWLRSGCRGQSPVALVLWSASAHSSRVITSCTRGPYVFSISSL